MNSGHSLPRVLAASFLLALMFAGFRTIPAAAVAPPVGTSDSYIAVQGVQLDVAAPGLLANDTGPAGYQLSATLPLNNGPFNGQLIFFGSDGSFSYLPDPGFTGPDTFTYEVHASGPGGDIAGNLLVQVIIQVQATANFPVGVDDAYSTPMDTPLDVDAAGGVLANDYDLDGDPLTAVSPTLALHGSVTVNTDGSFHYQPNSGYLGDDLFYYWAEAAGETSPTISAVTITVTSGPANQAPVNGDDLYTSSQDTQLMVDLANSVLLNDSDPDGDGLTVPASTNPAHGSVWMDLDGTFMYEPDAGFVGTDTFSYSAFDGADFATTPATVSINVLSSAPNNPPVGVDDVYSTPLDTPLDENAAAGILANDSDPDGDPLSVESPSSTQHGTLMVNTDGSFHYEPDSGFVGTDFFTYWASAAGDSAKTISTVEINVGGGTLKHLPVGVDDAYSTSHDTQLTVAAANSVLMNDSDQDGDALQANLVLGPMHAQSFALNPDGTFIYEPLPGFVGADTFHYLVSDIDGNALSSTLVTIDVTPTQDPGPAVTPEPTEDPGSDVTPEPTEPADTPSAGTPDVTPTVPDGSAADPSPTALVITTLPNTGIGRDQGTGDNLALMLLIVGTLSIVGMGFSKRRSRD